MSKFRLRRIGVASNASAVRPTLYDCITLVLAQVDGLAEDVLAALKRSTAEPVGEPGQDAPDAGMRAAVKELLTDSDAVRATMVAELRRVVFHSGPRDLSHNQAVRFEDLRFFDIHEIEIHIELALARQEVMRAADDVLPLFDSLISALLGWSTVQPTLNPLKPEAFVRALLETLAAWVPDEAMRMAMLRPAAIAMGIGLRQLYREACDWMRSQGIHPVELPASQGPEGAAARARQAQGEVERTMQTLEKLRRLLAGEVFAGAGGGVVQDFTHTVPGSLVALQDMRLVEPMMKRLAERSVRQLAHGTPLPASAASIGPATRSKAQNQHIGRVLGGEVVGLMIDQLVNDDRLLLPVRQQLRALEPALLQLAKADPRFFIDRRHPARQLLDRVVQRSSLYAATDDQAIADFTSCVSDAVNALSRSAGDAASYAGILEELEKAWDSRDAARLKQRDEERQAQEHALLRSALAQRFSDAMMERFRNGNVPEMVAAFLRGPWSQVLAESHLRSSSPHADPRGYLALVDDLVWSVQLPLIRQDYARLVRLIPRLLARIHEGLVLIRYPQEPVSILLDDLSALHEQVLEDHRRAVAAARASAQAAGQRVEERRTGAADTRGEQAPERRRPFAVDAAAMQSSTPSEQTVGAIVELKLGGEWVRAELTWISRNRNLFMFVSGAGLAHAMSRRTMERLESQERIRVVSPALDLLIESGMVPLGPMPAGADG